MDDGEPSIRSFLADEVIVVTFVLISVAAVVGNAFLVLSFVLTHNMHSVTCIFIISKSVSDVLTGTVVLFFAMVTTVFPGRTIQGQACEVPVYIELACVVSSVFSLLAVGVDRYLAVVHPTRKVFNHRSAWGAVCAIWLLSVVYSCRLVFQFQETRHGSHFCNLFVSKKEDNLKFRSIDFVFLFCLPAVALGYLNQRTARILWRKTDTLTENVIRKRRVVKFLAASFTLFCLSWSPFYLLDILRDVLRRVLPEDAGQRVATSAPFVILRFLFVLMAFCNCFLSPLLYAIFFPAARKETRKLMAKFFRRRCLGLAPTDFVSDPVYPNPPCSFGNVWCTNSSARNEAKITWKSSKIGPINQTTLKGSRLKLNKVGHRVEPDIANIVQN